MSFDRFPPDADHLVSHMQPQVSRSSSPSRDESSSGASRAPSSNDPYYSNDDIAVLHAIVVAAQEILDHAPEPKPLPAPTLFRAYDIVLPNYGIDPDDDRHLSRFVFRIGGERGDGNLIDKFQAILSRMGIVLEFGDSSTDSPRPSHQTSSPQSSVNSRPNGYPHPASDDSEKPEFDQAQHHPPLAIRPTPQDVGEEIEESTDEDVHHEEDRLAHAAKEEEELRARARRAALSAVLGRWRSAASHQTPITSAEPRREEFSLPTRTLIQNGIDHSRHNRPLPNITEEVTEEEREALTQQSRRKGESGDANHQHSLQSLLDAPRPASATSPSLPLDNTHSSHNVERPLAEDPTAPAPAHDTQRLSKEASQGTFPISSLPERASIPSIQAIDTDALDNEEQDPTERPPIISPEQLATQTPPQPPPRTPPPSAQGPTPAELEAKHEKDLKQAARARELYLASKVFNHWADRTARRLEREAVARRHMIRFRYFRLWSQAPTSRDPTIEQMRANVAVKKWQRSASEENDLERIAQHAADAHRRKTIGRALDRWNYHRLEHAGQEMMASRARAKALAFWTSQVEESRVLSEAIEEQTRFHRERDTLEKWKEHAQLDNTQLTIARRISTAQQTFIHLREWWDQAELGRRAAAYRQHLLLKKASFAFDQWNLRARAQAFVWRREYVSVIRTCDQWCRVAETKRELQREAESHYETLAKSKLAQSMRRQHRILRQMTHLESRALLYIRGTRMLNVLDQTARQRKDRDKQSIKQYLMARYTQVSAARKKRNFFAALDKWRIATELARAQAQDASELKSRYDAWQQMTILQSWIELAETDQRHFHEAQLRHVEGVVDIWKGHARGLEQQEMEAWQIWASERQRNCLKEWSIASLQQSGQAHTASEVHKKHNRQKRNRYLQQWRQLGERPRPDAAQIASLRNSTAFSQSQAGVYRGSWRALSGRRSVIRRNERIPDYPTNMVETPTRWTGQLNLVSSIMPGSSMAPVREADEDAASSTTGEDVAASPSRKARDRRGDRFFGLSTTTPRAPVPSYLERDFQDGYEEPESNESASADWPGQRVPTAPLQRMTPMPTHTEVTEPDSVDGSASFLRPPASTTAFGFRPVENRSPVLKPSSLPLSRVGVSKSINSKPSGLRYGLTQSSELASSTRSVRIQSPKSFSTTPRPPDALKPGIARGMQHANRNAMNG